MTTLERTDEQLESIRRAASDPRYIVNRAMTALVGWAAMSVVVLAVYLLLRVVTVAAVRHVPDFV